MTHKYFWDDPYCTHLDTMVSAVWDDQISLRETIFYAFSGGQESDSGTIGGFPVLYAQKHGLDIRYTLPVDHGLRSGDAVKVVIDWERRYALMRLHFAAELVLELCSRRLNGIEKIGAHISAERARIDFAWPENLTPVLQDITVAANGLIAANHAIRSAFSDEQDQRRYWEIAGFARVACGGTHLRYTGEVGLIALRRRNIGGGKERIEITLHGGD